MTTIPNLNPIPAVTGDDYLITHDITTNRSGKVSALSLKDYISSQIISDQDITAALIPYSSTNVEDRLNKTPLLVPKFSDLSSITGTLGDVAITLEHTNATGVGGNIFICKPATGLVSDTGSVVITGSTAWVVKGYKNKVVDASDYGARQWSVGDPFDSTTAIQNAVNFLSGIGGGKVLIPFTAVKFSNIDLKNSVILEGLGSPTTAVICEDTVNSIIVMDSGSKVKGFKFYYPNQVTNATPIVYPATIKNKTSAGYLHIDDCWAQGAYDFIVLGSALGSISPVWITNCKGFPLHKAISADWCIDTLRIDNCHFNQNIFGGYGSTLKAWVYQNGTALEILRCDNPQVSNFHCYGYDKGLYGTSGNPSGSINMAMFNNCNFDVCRTPLSIVNHQDGVFFNNCTFTTGGASYNGIAGEFCFVYGNQHDTAGNINFTNCSFRTFNTKILLVNSSCRFKNCNFDDYNIATGSYPAIEVDASNVSIHLSLTDIDGRSRAGSLGIVSNTAEIDLKIFGGKISNLPTNTAVNIRGRFYAVGVELPSAHFYLWNGVSCKDINGVLCTYQIPSAFTVTSPGFLVGDRFGQQLPTAGQPKAWSCTTAGIPATWLSEGNF